MNLLSKIILGSAQFGSNYGLTNMRGKIPSGEIKKILSFASLNKIDCIDTARSYGDSEKKIGEIISRSKTSFKIITKLEERDLESVEQAVNNSKKDLKIEKVYGVLFHNFAAYLKKKSALSELNSLKHRKIIEKIGFSLYYPKELEYLLSKKIPFDIVQIPFNIFDQRFLPYFSELKKRKVEIHARSIFLQGLLLLCPENVPDYFQKIKNKLIKLRLIEKRHQISLPSLCLNFALKNKAIDKVLMGVSGFKDLKENILEIKHDENIDFQPIAKKLVGLAEKNEKIIVPVNWPA